MGEIFYFERLCWYHLSQQGTTCSKLQLKHMNMVWKLFRINNEDNDIVLVSLLLTMNIFQTCSKCWLWTSKPLPGSYWKDQHFWRQDRVYHALCCNILKFISKWHLILYLHNLTSESVKNFCEGIYFRLSFCLKNCDSYSKWPAVHLSF